MIRFLNFANTLEVLHSLEITYHISKLIQLIGTNFKNKTFSFFKRSELKVIYDQKIKTRINLKNIFCIMHIQNNNISVASILQSKTLYLQQHPKVPI